MATLDIAVPDIGDFDEVTVIELLVKPGDSIKADQSLLTVESDKASMEIPSSAAGVVKEVKVKLGDKVKQGSIVLSLESADLASDSVPKAIQAEEIRARAAPELVASKVATVAAATTATTASAANRRIDVHVPDIGDFKDVTVIEVLVKAGDSIKVEQSLVTVESDKASMEIPSSGAGVLQELKVKLGDKINIGDLLAVLEGSAAASAPASAQTPAADFVPAAQAAQAVHPEPVEGPSALAAPAHNPTTAPTGTLPHASPSVRKFARELGVYVSCSKKTVECCI